MKFISFTAAMLGLMATSASGTALSMSNVGSLTAQELNILRTLDPAQKKEAESFLASKAEHHSHKHHHKKGEKHHHHHKHDQGVSMLQSGATAGAGAGASSGVEAVLERREQALKRDKNVEHNVMSDFMRRFSRNMRAAVLEDSKGDMPEGTRQKLISEIQDENYRVDHGMKSGFKNIAEERKELDVAGAVDGKRHDGEAAPAAPEVIQHTKPKRKQMRMLNAPIQPDDAAPAAADSAPAAPASGSAVHLLNTAAAQSSEADAQQQDGDAQDGEEQPPQELNLSQSQYERLITKCTDAKCEKRLKMLRARTADREARGQIPAEADAVAEGESSSDASQGVDDQQQEQSQEPPTAAAVVPARSQPAMMNNRPSASEDVAERDVRIAEAGLDGFETIASAFTAWARNLLSPV